VLALIPLFPFLGFLVNASLGRRLSKTISGGIACLVMLLSFAASALEVWRLAGMVSAAGESGGAVEGARAAEITQTVFTWIASGDFVIDVAFRLDPLSAVMILVITGIGSLIHIYSTSYMHEETDSEYARYFSYLNLFVFFMLLLVLGSNVLIMFVGWEGVGLCSYLLIGYYYVKKSASDAANKAFIVNRVGDYAFILSTLLLLVTVGTLDFREIASRVASMPVEMTFGTLSLVALLLFIGATGKSAQIPLYVWLPDAMEGPTPVSALIHAATMVTAGVYMIGRTAVLFEHAPVTLNIVAIIGAATALFAGTIGLVQNDIKRVLAYSTVSQLGYMFLAMGVGAFGAGIFHLYTHAFFKALLFLGSGAVIHALHGEQDIRRMGGLKKYLPITYWTFIIGSLAIAGVPLLSGFFSKDEILFETFYRGHVWLWVVATLTSLLTAVYMWRLVHLTFHGRPRFALAAHDDHADAHPSHPSHPVAPHDAPPAMAIALVVLAIGSVAAGYIGLPHALGGHNQLHEWLTPAFQAAEPTPSVARAGGGTSASDLGGQPVEEQTPAEADHAKETLELQLMALSSALALIGIGIATFVWLKRPEIAAAMESRFPTVHRWLLNKYYVDELYDVTVVEPVKIVSEDGLWRGMDARLVDGAVNTTGQIVAGLSAVLRLLQSGSVKTYAVSTFFGVVAILGYYLWR
jgi:NADH-quinone oxidoreductase subunit L